MGNLTAEMLPKLSETIAFRAKRPCASRSSRNSWSTALIRLGGKALGVGTYHRMPTPVGGELYRLTLATPAAGLIRLSYQAAQSQPGDRPG